MKTELELGTQLVDFINVGMYESSLDPRYFLEDEELEDEMWDSFNNKEYKKFVHSCAEKILKQEYLPVLKELNLNIIDAKGDSIHSPKFYNYSTDEFYFDITLSSTVEEAWNKYFETVDQGKLDSFLRENNKSYDGFVSFMPQSIEELEDHIKSGEDNERSIAAILRYELANDLNEYQEDFEELLQQERWNYDFFNSNEEEVENEVSEKFVKTFESWDQPK